MKKGGDSMKRNALTMFLVTYILLALVVLVAGCGGHNKPDTIPPGGGQQPPGGGGENVLKWEFNTDGDVLGFVGNNSTLASSGGSLIQTVTAAGTNSFLLSPDNLEINAATYKYIKIRVKNNFTTAGYLAIQWVTTADAVWDTTWNTGTTKTYVVSATGDTNDGQFHEYVINLSAQANWTGTISRLRIKLTPDTPPEANSVEVDYIRVSNVP